MNNVSKKLFTDKEIKVLTNNKYVKNITAKAITYTDEFKMLFISEYNQGKPPMCIFQDAGFDIDIIGKHRIWCASKRWRKDYNKEGELGLKDSRKFNSGRRLERELTLEEIIARKDAEIAYWKAESELLKKIELQERQVRNGKLNAASIYSIIENIVSTLNYKNTIKYLCEAACVSRSGYYNYLKSSDRRKEKEEKDLALRDLIMKIFEHRGYKKGSRSIKMVLAHEFNITLNRKRIQRIMRKYDIKCPIRKANPYRSMMKATHEHTVVPNILNREFKQEVAGKVLLTDITYLSYGTSNRAYLSTIKDGSTNEILAYKLSKNITLDIAIGTIKNLVKNHKDLLSKDSFVHSDQGAHYTSPTFQKLLKKHNLRQSMSRRGNCWDNAPQESFFGHMKDEIDLRSCTNFEDLELLIHNYINYYNNYRYQWGLKKLAPVQYRNQLIAV